jgi:hypothetical protein
MPKKKNKKKLSPKWWAAMKKTYADPKWRAATHGPRWRAGLKRAQLNPEWHVFTPTLRIQQKFQKNLGSSGSFGPTQLTGPCSKNPRHRDASLFNTGTEGDRGGLAEWGQTERKKKEKVCLDINRPSHGRTYAKTPVKIIPL